MQLQLVLGLNVAQSKKGKSPKIHSETNDL